VGRLDALAERLRAVGLPVRIEAAPLDLPAEVLAEIHGDPMRLLDGEPIPSRSWWRCTRLLPGDAFADHAGRSAVGVDFGLSYNEAA
jgi:hypothetical protein